MVGSNSEGLSIGWERFSLEQMGVKCLQLKTTEDRGTISKCVSGKWLETPWQTFINVHAWKIKNSLWREWKQPLAPLLLIAITQSWGWCPCVKTGNCNCIIVYGPLKSFRSRGRRLIWSSEWISIHFRKSSPRHTCYVQMDSLVLVRLFY